LFFAALIVGYNFGAPAKTAVSRESTVALLLSFYERHGCFPSDSSFSSDRSWYDVVWPLSWERRFRDSLRREAGAWRFESKPASNPNEVRIFLTPSQPSQKSRLVLHLKDGIVLPLGDVEGVAATAR
jgi:hypothetical protein